MPRNYIAAFDFHIAGLVFELNVARSNTRPQATESDPIVERRRTHIDIYRSTGVNRLYQIDAAQQPVTSERGAPNQPLWNHFNKRELAAADMHLSMLFDHMMSMHGRPTGGALAREDRAEALLILLVSIKYSQKAGCRCGCSPKWVASEDASLDISELLEEAYGDAWPASFSPARHHVFDLNLCIRLEDELSLDKIRAAHVRREEAAA